MEIEEMEDRLNIIVRDVYTGLSALAEKVRCEASPDEIADNIAALAGIICDHWPDCFATRQEETSS
jgi:hypothetical protein